MDKDLFSNFIVPFKKNREEGIYKSILLNAQDKIECKDSNYYNFYPQEERNLQLILETDKDNKVKDFFFHHTSNVLWKLRIISQIDENTYLVHCIYNSAIFPIRLVNAKVLGNDLQEGKYIMAQISAFAIKGNIYKDKEEYLNEVKTVNLESGEIAIPFKGTIKRVGTFGLWMYFIDFPKYYCIMIDYNNEEIPVFIPHDFISKNVKRFGRGNYFVGNILISGDVCIDKYEKLIKDNDYIK